jgi:hypothetical protein
VRTHIVLDLAEPCDRQAAAIVRPQRCDVRVFLSDINRQKVCEGSDTFRVARSSDRQHLGAGKTQMRRRFIPAEEVNHLNSASLASVDHFKCCEILVHAKMDVNHVYLRPKRDTSSRGGAYLETIRAILV